MLPQQPMVLSPRGEFDIYSQSEFAAALNAADDHPYVVIDFTDVHYLDSTCISVLIRMRKRRRSLNFPPVHFAGMRPLLKSVFRITALDHIWPIFDTVEEACAAFDDIETGPKGE